MGRRGDSQGAEPGGGDAPCLRIESGPRAGQRFALELEEIVIGRSPGSDVSLPDDGLSREHAVILRCPETGTVTIEDLQSSNGTKVNGKRVRSAELCHGDEVTLGRTVFRFLEPGLPERRAHRGAASDDDDTQAFCSSEEP